MDCFEKVRQDHFRFSDHQREQVSKDWKSPPEQFYQSSDGLWPRLLQLCNSSRKQFMQKKGSSFMRKVIVTMWVTLDGFIAGPKETS